MRIIGKVFPKIYEKKFYTQICKILAYILYALILMIIFGIISSNHNNQDSDITSFDNILASKVRENISKTKTNNRQLLSISKERAIEFKNAVINKDKEEAIDLATPVIKKAKSMKTIDGIIVK